MTVQVGNVTFGQDKPIVLISGPCQLETLDHARMLAETLAGLAAPGRPVFLVKIDDTAGLDILEATYPEGKSSVYEGRYPSQSFIIYYVP